MGRCKKGRNIGAVPSCKYFKPSGICKNDLKEIELQIDEFEALRLADVEGFDMKVGAETMDVSAPTFCRILARARKKTGQAIVFGHTIKICDYGKII